ncbi:MAG: ATP-binding protein [Thermoanaerobaculia bacterium]
MDAVQTFRAGAPISRVPQGSPVIRYGLVPVAVALTLGIRLLLHPVLGGSAPLLMFVLAVLVCAWYGGWGPGVAATVASALAGWFFFLPDLYSFGGLGLADAIQIATFGVIGMAVSSLHGRLRSSRAREAGRLVELQASEERVRQLAETLEQRVEQRTAELEAANRALEAFAYSVSHDLRAPLRGIQGFAQALLEDYGDRLDGTGHDYARRIAAAAGRMEQLIQDILVYSRLSRADLELAPVALDSAVREAQAEVELPLRQRGGEVAVEGPLPRVRAHRPTLVQVLTNLLSNAVLYVAPGAAPRIRVRAEERGSRTRLWVEDEGIGIAPEHQERIFDVFERLHGSDTYPGTGIGLAIVRKGVERMGGSAGVESEPGSGSRFWIELTRAEEPNAA